MLRVYEKLFRIDKRYLSGREICRLLDISEKSRRVTLSRLTRRNVLRRLRRDTYEVVLRPADILVAANIVYRPSYLSFIYCLGRRGIMSQIAYEIEFATPKKSKRMVMRGRSVVFRQMAKRLFFGYSLEDGIFIAEPEKALLDTLYMKSKGLASLDEDGLDLSDLSREKFLRMSEPFPANVRKAARRLARRMKGKRKNST